MKLQRIEEALNSLKEEDQVNLSKLLESISLKEVAISNQKDELDIIKEEKERLERIKDVLESKAKKIYLFLPIFEIPLFLVIILFCMFSSVGMNIKILLFVVEFAICFDVSYNFNFNYAMMSGKTGIVACIKDVLTNCFTNKEKILRKIENIKELESISSEELEKLESELLSLRSQADDTRDNLSYLEGNIQGIEYLTKRKYFDSISDDNQVVVYINEKMELRKRMN